MSNHGNSATYQKLMDIYFCPFNDKPYHPVKCVTLARQGVSYGFIKKQPCEVCGDPNAQMHHDNYCYPLKVKFLCRKHHKLWHRFNKHTIIQTKKEV